MNKLQNFLLCSSYLTWRVYVVDLLQFLCSLRHEFSVTCGTEGLKHCRVFMLLDCLTSPDHHVTITVLKGDVQCLVFCKQAVVDFG